MPAPLPLGVLAAELGAQLEGDPDLLISGVAEPRAAGPGQLAVLTDPAAARDLGECQASAFLVLRRFEELPGAQLICADASRALGQLLQLLAPAAQPAGRGIHPTAVVEPGAEVHPDAWIGPLAYVGRGAVVGQGTRVEPLSYLGPGVEVGQRCVIGPRATVLAGCQVGDRAVLGPGSVVGHHGFGFWRDDEGWHRVRSTGSVTIGADAELGANSCVDRATLGVTRVGDGVKIDNLVQVGHNCQLSEHALLCAQVGLAGSVRLGSGATLGGQVGVADHREVGHGARVGAGSGVARDVPDGADHSGYPAQEHRAWLRNAAAQSGLAELVGEVRALRQRVAELEQGGTRNKEPGTRNKE